MRFKRQIAFILIINIVIGLCTGSSMPLGVFQREQVYGSTVETESGDNSENTEYAGEGGEIQGENTPSNDITPPDGVTEEGTEGLEEGTEGLEEGTEDLEEGTEDLEEGTEDLEEGTEDLEEGTEDLEEGTEDLEEETEDLEEETEDLEELEDDGIMLLDLQEPNIPDNLDALAADGRTWFSITQPQDWLNLQKLSQLSSLDGYTFEIGVWTDETGGRHTAYDFSDISDDDGGFVGIGTAEFPFRGTLIDGYATGVLLYTNYPLFQYLSSDAHLSGLRIRTQSCTAGLAKHFVAQGDAPSLMNYANILIESGTLGTDVESDGDKIAGGLFCDVIYDTAAPDTPLLLQGNTIKVSSRVNGVTAGGLIGKLDGGGTAGRKVTLVLDGGIEWTSYTAALAGNTADAKKIGGWIGELDGVDLTVRAGSSESEIVVTRTVPVDATTAFAAGDVGGLFGLISDSTVTVENAITYNGNKKEFTTNNADYDLCGGNAGTFAGRIKNSTVTLNASFATNYVRFAKTSTATASATTTTAQGIGGFAGVMDHSVLTVAENGAGLLFKNTYVYGQNTASYNVGGLVGYAVDSQFLFAKESPCTIEDFVSNGTYGNTAGAVGQYVADNGLTEQLIMQYVKVTGNDTGIIAYGSGNAGGLVGSLQIANAPVEISDCSVGDMKYFAKYGAFGVAYVKAAGEDGSLILTNIICDGTAAASTTPVPTARATAFGGMIGYADASFTVRGDVDEGDVFSSAVWYQIAYLYGGYTRAPQYVGAVAGQIATPSSGYRKVDISDLLVGSGYETYNAGASYGPVRYGGLIGDAGEKTSVCLDGKIYQNGDNNNGAGTAREFDGQTHQIEAQYMCLNNSATSLYFGSIAGFINNTLIYLQPSADWQPSARYRCNEIGNYGGMIRNGNWDDAVFTDPDNTTEQDYDIIKGYPEKWIIQDHQVKGKLDGKLSSYGDFIRFAVAMNTGGGFLPEGNTSYDQIRTGTFALTGTEYNLKWLGIMTMGRNDSTGISDANKVKYAFQGSWSGQPSGGTTLIYGVPSYRQSYIGLFPWVSGRDGAISFTDLNLEYELSYQWPQYANSAAMPASYSSNTTTGFAENAGGLATYADGEITVSNVRYKGTISDLYNNTYNGVSDTEYFGGIFGKYTVYGKTLTISNLTTDMSFTQRAHQHVFGGVIAYVDTRTSNTGMTGQIKINDVELNGEITIAITENTYVGRQNVEDSAFITKIGNHNNNYTYNTATNLGTYTKYCEMSVENLTVGEVVQKTSSDTKQYASMGGFLGYSWMDTEVSLKNIQIGKAGGETCELSGKAVFGGLIFQANGKMTVEDLKLQNWTVNAQNNISVQSGSYYVASSPSEVNCGLFIRNGQYLYLNISGYTIGDNVTVKNYSGSYFDEIVGFNKKGTSEDNGGILSVNSTETEGRHLQTDPDVKAYFGYPNETAVTTENGAPLNKGNPNTRYYYDLDKIDFAEEYSTGAYTRWSDARDVMAWHVLHYANKTLRPCICGQSGTSLSLATGYTVNADISMKGWSIYPTPMTEQGETYNANGHTIALYAQEIIDGEKAYKQANSNYYVMFPNDLNAQHYQMHAGIFGKVTQALTVKGLHLSGTYSKSVDKAGALVAGEISSSEGIFEEIVLDDLKCVSGTGMTDADYDAPIGLLIAKIIWNGNETSSTDLKFSDIRMVNYENETDMAASSLIGSVGDTNAKNIKILFTEMGMTDLAATANLARSSMIYRYDYKEECTVIYTFTYQDYIGEAGDNGGRDHSTNESANYLVTIGEELKARTEDLDDPDSKALGYDLIEYFDEDYAVGKNPDPDAADDVLDHTYDSRNYIPYVYTGERQIIVNPKSKNIDVGCGTYEDPYVIDSVRQIQTLYRYLYEEADFKEMLEGQSWTVNATGDDSSFCNGTHTPETYTYDYTAGRTGEDFPSKAELSQAYYKITVDIDLSDFIEFFGFGTTEEPFVGVFVGDIVDDTGEYPVITLPKQPTNVDLTQFGWIRNTKGTVVKDLTIRFVSQINISSAIYSTDFATEKSGYGAGVFARVLGGENIIDNVTVECVGDEARLSPTNSTASGYTTYSFSMIGGYVGAVELGGVIIRNMNQESLNRFKTGVSTDNYWYTCGIIGRVYDGYVVYEGEQSDGALITCYQDSAIGSNYYDNPLPASRSYDIINAAYLEKRISETGSSGIVWTGSGYEIANDAELLALSMALNAGMMDYNSDVDSKAPDLVVGIGYNNVSRQRGGNYDYIGEVDYNGVSDGGASKNAYGAVIRYDNNNNASDYTYHSYLMKFFANVNGKTINGHNILDSSDRCILNPKISSTSADPLTYKLTANGLYDMTQYQTGFRGFGARYRRTYNNVFQSNMQGPENGQAQIELNMEVDKIQSSTRAALLNEIDSTGKTLGIKNILLLGQVSNTGDRPTYYVYSAAGFASQCASSLEFTNVDLDGLTVTAQSFAGGYVAAMTGVACDFTDTDLTDVNVVGGNNQYSTNYGYAGGMIAKFENSTSGSRLKVEGKTAPITVKGITVTSPVSSYVRVGGMIGSSTALENSFSNITVTNIEVTAPSAAATTSNSGSTYTCAAGGILGYVQSPIAFSDVTVGSSTDPNGKIIVRVGGTSTGSNLNSGSGGFAGRLGNTNARMTVNRCALLGMKTDTGYTTQIDSYVSAGGISGNSYSATVTDLTVQGVSVKGGTYLGGYSGWTTSDSGTINCTNIKIKDCYLAMKGSSTSSAGDIGGLIGHNEITETKLTNCQVDGVVIDATHTGRVGGLIGYGSRKIDIDQTGSSTNEVKNSLICGVTAGGLFGQFAGTTTDGMNDITVSGNRIVSGYDSVARTSTYRAGGFAGYLNPGDKLYFNNISIKDNLIAAYPNTAAWMGGMIGESNGKNIYVYHAVFKDNYIGVLQGLSTTVSVRQAELKEHTDPSYWKDSVYARTDADSIGAATVAKYADLGAVPESDLWMYAYREGAVAGGITADSATMNTFVDINIQYTDNTYRPVSDVGMTAKIESDGEEDTDYNAKMYAAYRQNYFIVYDGMETENSTSVPDWLPAGVLDAGKDGTCYTFENLEDILDGYSTAKTDGSNNIRYAYRLSEDYLGGESVKNPSIEDVIDLTYWDEEENKYFSPITYKNTQIPMIYYESSDAGSLDSVIQTYINMLTNNSGALNSFSDQKIAVETTRMRWSPSGISVDSDQSKVSVRNSGDAFPEFVNRDQKKMQTYDTIDDNTGTFTLIKISYLNDKSGEVEWTLLIPVYVEQRLDITTNVRIMNGIEYNFQTVINDGLYLYDTGEVDNLGAPVVRGNWADMDSGNSYSMYFEYIYSEVRNSYPGKAVPKWLTIDVVSDTFGFQVQEGTQMTLVDLDHNGKQYFYEVTGREEPITEIPLTAFTDIDGKHYEDKYVSDENVDPGTQPKLTDQPDRYTDIAGNEYENVGVERYLLLVNRSGMSEENYPKDNFNYHLNVNFDNLGKKDHDSADVNFFNRIEWTEVSYAGLNESMGLHCDDYDLDEEDTITKNGQVELKLDYKLEMSDMSLRTNKDRAQYVDVGFYLTDGEDGPKIALPQGTVVIFNKKVENGEGEPDYEHVDSIVVNSGSTVYYYNSQRDSEKFNVREEGVMQSNGQNASTMLNLGVTFDFSNVSPTELQQLFSTKTPYIHADLVTFEEGKNPVDGETLVEKAWMLSANIDTDIGFALNEEQLIELGMNQYLPDITDAGLISYTENIEFPEEYVNQIQYQPKERYYTIIYQLEEKTGQPADGNLNSVYQKYTGGDITLYRGDDPTDTENPVTGAASFKITSEMIKDGAQLLPDGSVDQEGSKSVSSGVIQIPCILVADRDKLDWTNYRIHAYLFITDKEPTEEQIAEFEESPTDHTGLEDYFVFTVAKVKTDMD